MVRRQDRPREEWDWIDHLEEAVGPNAPAIVPGVLLFLQVISTAINPILFMVLSVITFAVLGAMFVLTSQRLFTRGASSTVYGIYSGLFFVEILFLYFAIPIVCC